MSRFAEKTIEHFAAIPLTPSAHLEKLLVGAADGVIADFHAVRRRLSEDEVLEFACSDVGIGACHGAAPEQLLEIARLELAGHLLGSEVQEARIALVAKAAGSSRPRPYDHAALAALQIDDDQLISLRQLEVRQSGIWKDGWEFHLLPALPETNSSWWIQRMLMHLASDFDVRVRLDPFIVQPRTGHRAPEYRMWAYGKPLDYERVADLTSDDHGRAYPEGVRPPGVAFTDFVWSPRGSERHLVLEEVPLPEGVPNRPGRYFHGILEPGRGFSHVDGAIRIYDTESIEQRMHTHVRYAGKAGVRRKLFRVEGRIPPVAFSALGSSFFVWNTDVMNYFAGKRTFPEPPEELAEADD
ncbi:MAG: hypothetical protein GF328_14100 [Candidatus Latescibacteria bacterium]|nr:hypothetical protein [Candidatus Latescibacterota bacterium]